MPRLISFPMRLDGTGSIASVEQDTDPEIEEQLAIATLTRPGERITVPTFGIGDPAFDRLQLAALQKHLLDFGPDVHVAAVEAALLPGDRERVSIRWSRIDDQREVSNL